MTKTNNSQTHKHIAAFTAALIMTVLIGVAMLAFGVNALLNRNVVSTAQAAELSGAVDASSQAAADQLVIDQLQAQISEYQNRETQYQDEIKSAADQVNQLSQQNQQYQSLVNALQNAGVIQITQDGRVFIPSNSTVSTSPRRGDD